MLLSVLMDWPNNLASLITSFQFLFQLTLRATFCMLFHTRGVHVALGNAQAVVKALFTQSQFYSLKMQFPALSPRAHNVTGVCCFLTSLIFNIPGCHLVCLLMLWHSLAFSHHYLSLKPHTYLMSFLTLVEIL